MENEDKVKIISFGGLALRKDTSDDQYSRLNWSIRMGYPRMSVYLDNSVTEKQEYDYDKVIIAPFDVVTINIFLDNLKKTIESQEECMYPIECFNVKYVDNKKTDDIVLQATAICGRNSDGVVYIAAIANDKKKVMFPLTLNTKWHKIINPNGDHVTDPRELSNSYAKAYYDRLKYLMDKYSSEGVIVKHVDKK